MSASQEGKLVVVSGPSGAGKTTVLKLLYDRCELPLVPSVSATTRPPRAGEVDGVDYRFLTEEEFSDRRRRGEFLECFEVFGKGYWYGTLKDAVTPILKGGKWVILEIDVQGALSVFQQYPEAITIFVQPGTVEELERRLRGRGTETEDAIQRRLDRARSELALAHRYQHQVTNDDLDGAVRQICGILTKRGG